MSTNSSITIKLEDGTFKQQYCHWDGMLEHNGKILFMIWKDTKNIENLLNRPIAAILRDGGIDVMQNADDNVTIFKDLRSFETSYQYGQEYNYLFIDGEWRVRYNDDHIWHNLEQQLKKNKIELVIQERPIKIELVTQESPSDNNATENEIDMVTLSNNFSKAVEEYVEGYDATDIEELNLMERNMIIEIEYACEEIRNDILDKIKLDQ